jgi:hypothetical protein
VDAKFFGELVTLPCIDPLIEKHRLTQTQQYQDGNEVVFLTDESESWSSADQQGGSRSDSQGQSQTRSVTDTQSSTKSNSVSRDEDRLIQAVNRARSEQSGSSASRSESSSATHTNGLNWSSTSTQGGSRTHKTTLVPRLRWREIVSSIQFLTADEQIIFGARDITRLATGEAVVPQVGETTEPELRAFSLAEPKS